jgi:hypothetical protein
MTSIYKRRCLFFYCIFAVTIAVAKPSLRAENGVDETEASAQAGLLESQNEHIALQDPVGCSIAPILNDRRRRDDAVVVDYVHHNHGFIEHWYPTTLGHGTLRTNDMYTPPLKDGNFIFWGLHGGTFEMSLFDSSHIFEGDHKVGGYGNNWKMVPPPSFEEYSSIHNVMTLQNNTNYIAFLSICFDQYQHLIIDHLGYLAFLRETTPPETRFLLAETSGGRLHSKLLEELDPVFAKRVDWITCDRTSKCEALVQVRGGGSLQVLRPQSSTRHVELLIMARQWILSTHKPINMDRRARDDQERTIVYYQRTTEGEALNGRLMDKDQERNMLRMIEMVMERYDRREKLVVFDGTIPFGDQISLFRSANVIIGAHGGGLANLLFTLPSESCETRPKVLEFATNPTTPAVQNGHFTRSYHNLYSTCPWVEFHHVFLVPPSNPETTFVDMGAFRDALFNILGGTNRNTIEIYD